MRKKPQARLEAESRRAFVEWAESEAGKKQLAEWVRKREEADGKKGQGK